MRLAINYLKVLLAIVLLGSAVQADADVDTISVREGEPVQRLWAWGFTAAPSDWDGMPMARDPQILSRLLSDSNAKIIRLIVGKSHDAMAQNTGKLVEPAFEQYVGRYIRALISGGANGYILSFATPPKFMKRYNIDASHLYLNPNSLKHEYYDEYTRYISDCVEWVNKNKLPLPIGISVQDGPDGFLPAFGCPPSLSQGCQFTPLEYRILTSKVRRNLDDRGFSNVQLLGPEVQSSSSITEYWSPHLSRQLVPAMQPVGESTALALVAPDAGRWIKAEAPVAEPDSRHLALAIGTGLVDNILRDRASVWLWPYGYSQEDTGEVLRHGLEEIETDAFKVLRGIWSVIPFGGRAHKLSISMASDDTQILGFSVSNDVQCAFIIINAGPSIEATFSASANFGNDRGSSFKADVGTWNQLKRNLPMAYTLPEYSLSVVVLGK